jgi:hypothetical protein
MRTTLKKHKLDQPRLNYRHKMHHHLRKHNQKAQVFPKQQTDDSPGWKMKYNKRSQ